MNISKIVTFSTILTFLDLFLFLNNNIRNMKANLTAHPRKLLDEPYKLLDFDANSKYLLNDDNKTSQKSN